MSGERTISIDRDIRARNAAYAHANRSLLRKARVFALNLVSTPGSGQTSLLVSIIANAADEWPTAEIEGDQRTSADADRIRQTGFPAGPIDPARARCDEAESHLALDSLFSRDLETKTGTHFLSSRSDGRQLDAPMVGYAFDQVPLGQGGLLFIAGVGNLVCPSAFGLGEACKVVVLSATKGEDKPLKYLACSRFPT